MKLMAINADITKMEVDAIVNAANSAMIIGGGVDGAIHAAAGQELINFNAQHHGFGCPTGQVKVTPGFNLPATYIIHTVGPDMRLYTQDVGDLLLECCYGMCIKAAIQEDLKSIAFPAISTGIFGFDKERAAKIAIMTMHDERFADADLEVTFACFGDEDTAIVQAAIDAEVIAAQDRFDEEHYLQWSVGDTDWIENAAGDYDPRYDLDTDVPDGVYMVSFKYLDDKVGVAKGVEIVDGKFVMEPTLLACAVARNKAGYHGTFLEGLDWNEDLEAFDAYFGS